MKPTPCQSTPAVAFCEERPPVRAGRLGLALLLTCTALCRPAAAGQILETFVLAVGGESNWATYGPPAPVANFFGGYTVSLPTHPGGIAAAGITGDFRLQSSAIGPLSDSMSVSSPVFPSTWSSANSFVGSSSATAQYGKLGVESHGTYVGQGDSFTVAGTDGFATFRETMNYASPLVSVGAPGVVAYHLTIDGNMAISGIGTAGVVVNYQQDDGPIYALMRGTVDPRSAPDLYPYSGPAHDAFSLTSTAISGSGDFDTFLMDMTWGTDFDFKLGMLSFYIPAKDTVADVNFHYTAVLSRIDAYAFVGGSWQAITNFSVDSASGTLYDAAGVHLEAAQSVPEPSSLLLMATGMVTLVLGRRRRCRMT